MTQLQELPTARAELYHLSYTPRAKWSMHEGVGMLEAYLILSLVQLGILNVN